MIQLIDYFLTALGIYIVFGVIFAIYFAFVGAEKLDEGVKGTPWHFRLIIFPGSILLWLFLLIKIQRKK